jgi:hypothetical protein
LSLEIHIGGFLFPHIIPGRVDGLWRLILIWLVVGGWDDHVPGRFGRFNNSWSMTIMYLAWNRVSCLGWLCSSWSCYEFGWIIKYLLKIPVRFSIRTLCTVLYCKIKCIDWRPGPSQIAWCTSRLPLSPPW